MGPFKENIAVNEKVSEKVPWWLWLILGGVVVYSTFEQVKDIKKAGERRRMPRRHQGV